MAIVDSRWRWGVEMAAGIIGMAKSLPDYPHVPAILRFAILTGNLFPRVPHHTLIWWGWGPVQYIG